MSFSFWQTEILFSLEKAMFARSKKELLAAKMAFL
jgi:hypothetical protein